MKYFLIDTKNRITKTPHSSSMFKLEMYHGCFVYDNKIGRYHKNIFKKGLIFKPDYDLVVDKSVLHIFEKEKLNEIKKIEHLKFFNFNYFDVTNEEIRYLDEYEKNFSSDGYYESGLKFVDSSKYELYMVRFLDFGDSPDKTLIQLKGLESQYLIDTEFVYKLQNYRCFHYIGKIFFCEELFNKIKPYLDMDFFEVVQVNIPEDIIFIKEER